MSYNIRLLDLYNWSKRKETRDEIIAYLKKKNPSVLCLQEFYTGNDSIGFNNVKDIMDACQFKYYASCYVNNNRRGHWGSIVFSKCPIVKSMNHDIDVVGSNQLQQVDIALGKDTFSVYNVHLKSNRFTKQENEMVEKKEISEMDTKAMSQSKALVKKLESNAVSRGLEADLVSNTISNNVYPSIICGDLNDIPTSYVYFKIRGKFSDAFLQKGFGLGATYNKVLPVLRIDYIFHDDRFKINGFEMDQVTFSDHNPLIVSLTL
ncbi:MAG: endonuclease/exonuclease/phosphatase family protein [Chitinophagaceae bacterium]|nr:endonuclease/exonuclease/phosphatase family protein [Chitinophagaceae bacterium]